MNSILSLIIVPFKLPEWIDPSNRKIMDNKHPYTKHYLARNYKKIDQFYTWGHPAMAEIILKNPDECILSIFKNPSPKLTKLIMKNFKPNWSNLVHLAENTNPELAKLIISQKDYYIDKTYWISILKNPNPGMTEFIKEIYHSVCYPYPLYINSNTNPELAEFILSNLNITDYLAENPNPGLTKFLYNSDLSRVDNNTNPELAPVIIERILNGDIVHDVYNNSNIGLTGFILSNPPTNQEDWDSLATNTNPGLEKFIYDNRYKIGFNCLHYLASNRNIFTPIKFD